MCKNHHVYKHIGDDSVDHLRDDDLHKNTHKNSVLAGLHHRKAVNVVDNLPSLPGLWRFFEYFRAMHDTASMLRYVDHKGQVHHVSGSSGGQQGDPLEMIRFCATIHPVWERVMPRYQRAMMMMTFITQGGEGRGKTNKKRKATKSKGRGLEEGASRALMRQVGEEGRGGRG